MIREFKIRPEQAVYLKQLSGEAIAAQNRLDVATAMLLEGLVEQPWEVVGGDLSGLVQVSVPDGEPDAAGD